MLCKNESDDTTMGKNNTDDLKIPIDADGNSLVTLLGLAILFGAQS
jgi:hypothetical protein